ncbi:hypothetical protein NB640_11120 [Oxalobacter vibrioformis]|uniref:Uncharacterized protein n=1 Tax=Oxalobacter vibrioformis TaxID=933080 RepID=A0A9E9P391_9BURK|nr:hypothetical protein [Oxalobacter vibrioformis]WAW09763.1 hypothetical protein NB640_11120 [Oxalobacter vibrioformis]
MNHHADINDNIDHIDTIMIYSIDLDEAMAYDNNNSAERFSKTEAVKEASCCQPLSDNSMTFIRNTDMNDGKKSRQKTRTRLPQSTGNNRVLQYLNHTRTIVGREPFKGLVIAAMAGFLVHARLFR